MSIIERAQTVGARDGELDAVARALFSKPYVRLTDAEAGKVWDLMESRQPC